MLASHLVAFIWLPATAYTRRSGGDASTQVVHLSWPVHLHCSSSSTCMTPSVTWRPSRGSSGEALPLLLHEASSAVNMLSSDRESLSSRHSDREGKRSDTCGFPK